MKKNAFTSKQACYLSGCTSHQLRYWDKVSLVSPSIQSSDGKPGVPKFYSFRDIVALRVIKTLLDNGMSIQRVRRAWKYLGKWKVNQGRRSSTRRLGQPRSDQHQPRRWRSRINR